MAKRRRRRRLKKGPVVVLFLILLLIFGGVYFYTHSKKYLFLKGLDNSYSNITKFIGEFVDDYMPYVSDDYYNNTDSSIKVVTSELDSTINLSGGIYLTSLSNYFDLNINANSSEYDLEMLSKDNKLYFKIDDSKYYYTNFYSFNFSNDGYFELSKIFIDNVKDNIKKGNLEKESSKVVIDSKNYDTKKITLNIDEKLYQRIMKDFYSDIKDNSDMLDVLFSLSDFSNKEELIKYFENDGVSLNNDIHLSIYLYKSSPIKVELSYGLKQAVSIVTYGDYLELDFNVEDSSSYIKFNDGKINLFLEGIGYGTGIYNDKSFDIDFTDYNKNPIGNIKYSIIKNNNKYSNKISLNLDLSDIDIRINSTNEIDVDKNIPSINVNDSVVVDNMLAKDKTTLSELLSTINLIFAF